MKLILLVVLGVVLFLKHKSDTAEPYSRTYFIPCNTTTFQDSTEFLAAAMNAGQMEVRHGKIAQQKASNPRVRIYAKKMVVDHSRSNKEIAQLAKSLKVKLPGSTGPDPNQLKDPLASPKGPAFDQAYMDMMLEDHGRVIELFEKARGTVKEPSIKKFIEKTLPVLRTHLDAAAETRKSL